MVAGSASITLTVVTVKHGVDDGLGSVLKHLVLRAVLAKCLGKGTGGSPGYCPNAWEREQEGARDAGHVIEAGDNEVRAPPSSAENVPCWPACIR